MKDVLVLVDGIEIELTQVPQAHIDSGEFHENIRQVLGTNAEVKILDVKESEHDGGDDI